MPHLPLASRRAVVGVGAVTLAPLLAGGLSACEAPDVGGLLPGADPSDRSGADGVAPPDPSADEEVVDLAVTEVAAALALVAAVRQRHARLRPLLAGLEAMHAAHLAALEGDPDEGAAEGVEVPGGPAAALAEVRRREVAHQRRLTDLAVRADSGQLAQLLASMAASVAQHLVALPRRVGAGR
ncbi:hypothetical protein [Nocardioides marmotae]|uniref:Uncharacterized protein n=1 Tax=Nocardioides marmotae TaxID=2663857 RepID=A0A6I3JBG3_9ACTN|nr:hypothetical protein [Nocardioides marmotae]MCR6031833.1 hypothetical protein [Gordonia jinghuaiqii]MBC9732221.1 hypothetical protein [Nocardioides marmotae]MTB83343.1 hypothetical protein [Nocardioides marmotae]MTB95474.1 hypothetical protein [Nocardioides marmotae]QKE00908.1 hypothetical protein HPC71_07360 [Nocardioides marmotae]